MFVKEAFLRGGTDYRTDQKSSVAKKDSCVSGAYGALHQLETADHLLTALILCCWIKRAEFRYLMYVM